MLKFALAITEDAKDLLDVTLRAFEEDRIRYGSLPPEIQSLDWHISKIQDGMYYKITFDNRIIGGFKLFNKGNNHFQLGSVFIEPKYHNQGIGSKVMKFIESEYPDVIKWSLDTPYKSYRNHYFYEKHGYKKVGELKPTKNKDFTLFLYQKDMNVLKNQNI